MTEPEQRTEQWFTARKGRVTGSIVGAILGVAPYMTREQAMRMLVRSYHGAEREFTGNIATEYGTRLEPDAVAAYEFKTGNAVAPAPFVPFEDWLGASPDGYVGDDGLLEVKCPFGLRNGGVFKALADQPHYYAQIQVQLYVTRRKWCDFWQWSPEIGGVLERVEPDQDWLDKNLPVLRQFYAEYLSQLDNPEHLEPLRIEVNTNETRMMIDEIDQLSEAIDNATARKKELMEGLTEKTGGKNALIWGRKFSKVEKEGAISYAKAIKDIAPNADLTKYKGKPSSYWKLS